MSKGYLKYFGKKIFWFIITFIVAVILNFLLPRLMPGDPVTAIVGKTIGVGADSATVQAQYEAYQQRFGLDKSMFEQFLIFCKNALRGDFGLSFSQYPRTVSDIISSSIGCL